MSIDSARVLAQRFLDVTSADADLADTRVVVVELRKALADAERKIPVVGSSQYPAAAAKPPPRAPGLLPAASRDERLLQQVSTLAAQMSNTRGKAVPKVKPLRRSIIGAKSTHPLSPKWRGVPSHVSRSSKSRTSAPWDICDKPGFATSTTALTEEQLLLAAALYSTTESGVASNTGGVQLLRHSAAMIEAEEEMARARTVEQQRRPRRMKELQAAYSSKVRVPGPAQGPAAAAAAADAAAAAARRSRSNKIDVASSDGPRSARSPLFDSARPGRRMARTSPSPSDPLGRPQRQQQRQLASADSAAVAVAQPGAATSATAAAAAVDLRTHGLPPTLPVLAKRGAAAAGTGARVGTAPGPDAARSPAQFPAISKQQVTTATTTTTTTAGRPGARNGKHGAPAPARAAPASPAKEDEEETTTAAADTDFDVGTVVPQLPPAVDAAAVHAMSHKDLVAVERNVQGFEVSSEAQANRILTHPVKHVTSAGRRRSSVHAAAVMPTVAEAAERAGSLVESDGSSSPAATAGTPGPLAAAGEAAAPLATAAVRGPGPSSSSSSLLSPGPLLQQLQAVREPMAAVASASAASLVARAPVAVAAAHSPTRAHVDAVAATTAAGAAAAPAHIAGPPASSLTGSSGTPAAAAVPAAAIVVVGRAALESDYDDYGDNEFSSDKPAAEGEPVALPPQAGAAAAAAPAGAAVAAPAPATAAAASSADAADADTYADDFD